MSEDLDHNTEFRRFDQQEIVDNPILNHEPKATVSNALIGGSNMLLQEGLSKGKNMIVCHIETWIWSLISHS